MTDTREVIPQETRDEMRAWLVRYSGVPFNMIPLHVSMNKDRSPLWMLAMIPHLLDALEHAERGD